MSSLNSFIAVSSNFDTVKDEISKSYNKHRIIEFFRDDFLLDDAKSVVKEAYIAEKDTKILLLGAKNYNLYAQNSLLKILEEPPLHVMFIVCVPSKTTLLPTIRSRLPLRNFAKDRVMVKTGLNFARLSLGDVYEFLKDKKYLPKNELADLVQAIGVEAIEQGVGLKSDDLDLFSKLLQLSALNSRASSILTTQLVTILKRV